MEKSIDEINRILNISWEYLKTFPNVLNISIGTKITEGVDTGIEAIRVYVSKKVDKSLLTPSMMLPKAIQGIFIDVIELSTPDYQLGETSISKQLPSCQIVMANGVRKKLRECSSCAGALHG